MADQHPASDQGRLGRRWSRAGVCGALLAALAACRQPPPPAPMTSDPQDPLAAAADPTPSQAAALPVGATPSQLAEPASPSQLADAASPSQLPDAASPSQLPDAASPTQARQEVQVLDTPPAEDDALLLAGYERKSRAVEVSTDRNAVEFPRSLTAARLSYRANPADQGAGKARALQLDLRLPEQRSPFAACSAGAGCGCDGVIPYAYISLSHPLPKGADLGAWRELSFWLRSREPFDLNVVLSCFVEPRPLRTDSPFDGYLDAAHTDMNPCWHAVRAELPLRAPIAVLGDDQWHRYQVRIDDLPASAPVTLSGGEQMICTLAGVTHVSFVLKKGHPALPGDYPKDAGVVLFDDLQAVGRR